MKKKNKGFLLLETIMVSTFIISTLVYLYVQFINLKKNYDISFRYDTITGLYNLKEIDKFISTNYGYIDLIEDVDSSTHHYIEIYNDDEINLSYFSSNSVYLKDLIHLMNAKTIIFYKNSNELKNVLKDSNIYSNELYLYILKQNVVENNDYYTLLVEYNDNTFASINVEKGE